MSTKVSSNPAVRSSSPIVNDDPEETLESLQASDMQPAQPTDVKKKKKKAAPPPPSSDDEEDEAVGGGAEGMNKEELSFAIRVASSKLFKELGRQATAAEIGDEIQTEEKTVKSSRNRLKVARQGQKLSGLRKAALKAGYSRRQGASRAEVKGLDVEQSMLTPADIQRLACAHPLDFTKGSYSPDEIAMRNDLIHEKLPLGSAREIIAFIEPFFRSTMAECVERQLRLGTQRITPSTMYAVLKRYNDLCVFTSCVPPAGLVRFAKENGIDLVKRGDPNLGYLMELSDEDKKESKTIRKEGKKAKESFDALVQAEAERKAVKRTKETKKTEEDDKEEAEVAPPPSKKKKKASVA